MATRIRPTLDKVLLKRLVPDTVTKSGLIIPEVAREKRDQAVVVAVGPGGWNGDTMQRIEPSVKPGDIVALDKWDGSVVEVDGVEHVFMREALLLAVIDP